MDYFAKAFDSGVFGMSKLALLCCVAYRPRLQRATLDAGRLLYC
jgi:hypothetical protein